tara:strand:+ start:891 stop:1325 length:435 start_codon:yes stop_codon:yes gene_type:complete
MTIFKNLKKIFIKESDMDKINATPYDRLGGEQTIRNLVHKFYYYMDTMPEAKECRDLHPTSLESSQEKLFMFLSGWLGGPSLYIEKYGHPRMRMRHMPFKIGEVEKGQWLLCMKNALNDLDIDSDLSEELWQAFRRFADHMKNS